jgi:hypothetical protein
VRHIFFICLQIAALAWGAAVLASAQFSDAAFELEHPAVAYATRATTDRVASLNRRLESGDARFQFDTLTGYLKPLLDALDIRVDSQIAVFSKTSLQSDRISPRNPRMIFFNDSVVVAWMRGGFIELAAHDPQQGAVFYRLMQAATGPPVAIRENRCLGCHFSTNTLGVPGFIVRSTPSAPTGRPCRGWATTSRTIAAPLVSVGPAGT